VALSQRQTAPYVALRGCTVTILSEDSPYCGQPGRVRRVFWGSESRGSWCDWAVGGLTAVPWGWTDLPVAPLEGDLSADGGSADLLSPVVLQELVRFLRRHSNKSNNNKHFNG
jgi:hypothetical protein